MKFFYQIKSESFPIQVAVCFFVLGSLLFLACLLLPLETELLILAFTFTFIAALTSTIVLLKLAYLIITLPHRRVKTEQELAAVLVNFPISGLYFFIIYNQNNLF